MKVLRRLLAFLLAAAFVLVFYVIAVMLEKEAGGQEQAFTVEAVTLPLADMQPLEGADAQALADAFGAALPLPEGFESGWVENTGYHGYRARLVRLRGSAALLSGIRPASAAPAILPDEAVFTGLGKALLGYPLLHAQVAGRDLYALMTAEAAFLIEPFEEGLPGGFSLLEPMP